MFTKAESAQPYIYRIFTPAGNCWTTHLISRIKRGDFTSVEGLSYPFSQSGVEITVKPPKASCKTSKIVTMLSGIMSRNSSPHLDSFVRPHDGTVRARGF
jgi:hypothetical protein